MKIRGRCRKFILCGLVLIILVTLMSAFILLGSKATTAYADSSMLESNPKLEQEFDDDCILVVLDEKISKVNKVHSKKFFGNVEIDSIIDLTKRETNKNNQVDGFRQILQIILKDSSKEKILEAITELKQIDGVLSAEPNYYGELGQLPNDPDVKARFLWGLTGENGINAESAWDITQGKKSVRVGIIDTGIANHADLNANLVSGWDIVHDNSITNDDTKSHGTHVAGTIGAVGNNKMGVAGVNWNVSLVPLQASNEKNKFSALAVIKAIQWAESKWGTDEQISILNYSVSGFGSTVSIRDAIKDYHGLFVWGAGNQDVDVDPLISENGSFDLPNLISVGALKENGERPNVSDWRYDDEGNPQGSNYSSSGNYVNIYAPGDNIYSTILNNDYGSKSGTSMAAPHVAGVAALMLSVNPKLTSSEIKQMLIRSADSINITVPSSNGGTKKISVKKLNAYESIKDVLYSDSYRCVVLETTNNPEGTQGSKQFMWIKNGKPWPSSIDIPTAPFGYEFTGYYYSLDYSADSSFRIYNDNGTFNKRNSFFKQENFNSSSDITLKCRWMPKNYYFVVGMRHAAEWDRPTNYIVTTRNYEESLSHVMADENTVNGDKKAFTRWDMTIEGGETIQFSTSTKLEFAVKDIILQYCRDYEERGKPTIYFYAIYDTPISCIAPGSLITLADGTLKPVEELTGNEILLVWDMNTGTFASAPILFIDVDDAIECKLINLSFSDGTAVEVIYEHAFWDCNLNEYIFLREDAAQYIGHWFNKQTINEDGNLTWTSVQLTDVTISQEYTAAYSPVTYSYLGYYVNGMLTMPGATQGLINIFEVDGSTMTYNKEAFERDIQNYGLFTYDEFYEILPVSEDVFNAFNGQYLKVAIGKGLLTEEDLAVLYSRYFEFLS